MGVKLLCLKWNITVESLISNFLNMRKYGTTGPMAYYRYLLLWVKL